MLISVERNKAGKKNKMNEVYNNMLTLKCETVGVLASSNSEINIIFFTKHDEKSNSVKILKLQCYLGSGYLSQFVF